MPSAPAARSFEVRHLQLWRALIAAIAAAMITFSPDHSAAMGLSVFSGFAILTAIAMFVAAWLIYPAGHRGLPILLGAIDVVAGMIAGMGPLRSDTLFFVLVVVWALAGGVAEGVAGLRARRADAAAGRSDARDAITVGALGVILAIALLCVPAGYALNYTVTEAHQTFTLTGITIGVGVFGGYAAIVAVFLAIAGFSPRKDAAAESVTAAASDEHPGGAA